MFSPFSPKCLRLTWRPASCSAPANAAWWRCAAQHPRLDQRQAPHHRRRAVRRRGRDGDEARADLRGGGGRAGRAARLPGHPAHPAGAPLQPEQSPSSWREQPHLALLCGRYEGVDERVRQHLVSDEISIGDYVLTGGELPALVVIDAVTRLIPGVLGDPDGALDDSHASGLLEYPHYTRPPEFRGWRVPEVLRLRRPCPHRPLAARSRRCCAPASAARTCWKSRFERLRPAIPEGAGRD